MPTRLVRFAALGLALTLSAGLASAGQGWYLLTPYPTKWMERLAEESSKPEAKGMSPEALMLRALNESSQRPLREWVHVASFDSAAACQKEADGQLKNQMPGTLLYAQYILARCIASDDPRLK